MKTEKEHGRGVDGNTRDASRHAVHVQNQSGAIQHRTGTRGPTKQPLPEQNAYGVVVFFP